MRPNPINQTRKKFNHPSTCKQYGQLLVEMTVFKTQFSESMSNKASITQHLTRAKIMPLFSCSTKPITNKNVRFLNNEQLIHYVVYSC